MAGLSEGLSDRPWSRALYKFRPQLEERIDVEHHISSLNEAVPGGFLTDKEIADIKSQSRGYEKASKLVEVMANKDNNVFEAFVAFLNKIKLTDLAQKLEEAARQGEVPALTRVSVTPKLGS